MKLFKLACIQYQSQKVQFQNIDIDREQLSEIQDILCGLILITMKDQADGEMYSIYNQQTNLVRNILHEKVFLEGQKAQSIINDDEYKILDQNSNLMESLGHKQLMKNFKRNVQKKVYEIP